MSKIKDRQKLAWEGLFYSIQRIDLLIVSISGAGIYVCLESIKYLSDSEIQVHFSVKVSGLFFLLAITINFFSQIYGKKSNEQDYLMCDAKLDAGDNISKSKKAAIDEYDKKAECYTKITNKLNLASMYLMFGGLLSIMIYFLFIF
tara:strand:+ start:4216 stop:4653 length:438 start_codon:yes stop_codon:yes gene_type:complete